MLFQNELVRDLEDLEADLESNVKLIEDAVIRLEAEANNWEVTRRGIVKAGVKQILKKLQAWEEASINHQ